MANSSLTLEIVHQALQELDHSPCSVTSVVRKAIRVARLRNDWDALYWLQIETVAHSDKEGRRRIIAEVAPHYDRESFGRLHKTTIEQYISLRAIAHIRADETIATDGLTGLSIGEIEQQIRSGEQHAPSPLPGNLNPVDAYFLLEQQRKDRSRSEFVYGELRKVAVRIGQRVHEYLSQVEKQLVFGQPQADIFETNRRYVDGQLRAVAPDTLEQLKAAYYRAADGTVEGRSHALTSCRRALKSLADRLYPAKNGAVVGKDGKSRVLTDAMFVARLWQFVADADAGGAATKMLTGDVERLGAQIDRLNELSSKGVHADVSELEVNMCVLNTYTVVGALLRLQEGSSAATLTSGQLRE